jgi:rod shape-determining protein MreD
MRRISVYFLLGFGFILLQTALFPKILPFYLKPDLLLILIVYLGLNEGHLGGGILSYSLGYLQDVFAGSCPGLYGFAFLVTFLAVRGAADRFNTESSILLQFMVFCGTLLEGGVLIFFLVFFADAAPAWSIILSHLLPQALFNLAAAFLLLKGVIRMQKSFGPRFRLPGLQQLDNHYEP